MRQLESTRINTLPKTKYVVWLIDRISIKKNRFRWFWGIFVHCDDLEDDELLQLMRKDVFYRALNFHVKVFLSSNQNEANKVEEKYFS